MARRKYVQSRQNAVLQWAIPIVVMIIIVFVQDRIGREIGWLALLAVLGFMVWFNVLYEKSREEEAAPENEAAQPNDSSNTGAA